MRRLVNAPGIVFALFALWKVSLLVFTAQPVPSNDAYFYDGAVVNQLHCGVFVNPTVAIARPYSGTEFFSPYPPLYQAVLFVWMSVFGGSAVAAVGLHVLLVIAWSGLVYLILRQLATPIWGMHLAGGFLFVVTFHDRPDTLAHVLGTGAVLLVVHWLSKVAGLGRLWVSTVLLALTFATSPQLGATYACLVGITVLAYSWMSKTRPPWSPLLVMGLTPFALLATGKYGFPRWWIGFLENAHDNPSTVGLHFPDAGALLKLVRTLPGFLLLWPLLAWCLPRIRTGWPLLLGPQLAVFLGAATALLVVSLLSLCYLTPNYITSFAAFLQPLTVGAGLAWLAKARPLSVPRTAVVSVGCLCILVGGIRAWGMTTWGVLCARDVSYRTACGMVDSELDASSHSDSKTVILSAAYLYAAANHTNLHLIHSDYVVRPRGRATESDLTGLLALKPGRLVLTQFDYYRRYEAVLEQLRAAHPEVEVRTKNLARVAAPDASPSLRKVVQHVAWAPVVVEFSWPQTGESK